MHNRHSFHLRCIDRFRTWAVLRGDLSVTEYSELKRQGTGGRPVHKPYSVDRPNPAPFGVLSKGLSARQFATLFDWATFAVPQRLHLPANLCRFGCSVSATNRWMALPIRSQTPRSFVSVCDSRVVRPHERTRRNRFFRGCFRFEKL